MASSATAAQARLSELSVCLLALIAVTSGCSACGQLAERSGCDVLEDSACGAYQGMLGPATGSVLASVDTRSIPARGAVRLTFLPHNPAAFDLSDNVSEPERPILCEFIKNGRVRLSWRAHGSEPFKIGVGAHTLVRLVYNPDFPISSQTAWVVAHNMATGSVRWQTPLPTTTGPEFHSLVRTALDLDINAGVIHVRTPPGGGWDLDVDDGRVLRRIGE